MEQAVIIALATVFGALLMLLALLGWRNCSRAQHAYHRVSHGLDKEEQEFKKVLEMQVPYKKVLEMQVEHARKVASELTKQRLELANKVLDIEAAKLQLSRKVKDMEAAKAREEAALQIQRSELEIERTRLQAEKLNQTFGRTLVVDVQHRPHAPTFVWQCMLDDNEWVAYDQDVSASIEAGFQSLQSNQPTLRWFMLPSALWSHRCVRFDRESIAYEADFERLVQRRVDGKYNTERSIRRVKIHVVQSHRPDTKWKTNPVFVDNNVCKYELLARDICADVSTDTDEFNKACAHFCRLLKVNILAVTQVDVWSSEATHGAFSATKASFEAQGKGSQEIWVFHGTNGYTVDTIMSTGFKVGGRDAGVDVVNGATHGHGVYTATGPSDPLQYTQSGRNIAKVILARAVTGTEGSCSGAGDSWRPKKDWVVFRTGAQLLPVYVVHYTPTSFA